MKLYKEAMRRLGLVGVALLAVSVILTAIFTVSSAGAALSGSRLNNVFDLMPTLSVFAYVGGLAFAYVGFSFLNKRADSDFYHSLPVRRADLYIANTLAALTWTVATVLLSALASLVVYLFVAAPFVPLYYPLGALFFIVATMLVYAAAAIAMSITGTLVTNIALTAVVLLLPRFLLFMIGRTVVSGVNIVGWWDLPGLLNPRTNVATGLLVMTRRSFLGTDFVTLGNCLYSLLLAAAEIFVGGVLFCKRPSELAERGAKNGKLQTLFACLLVLPVLFVMLRYILDIRKLTIAILIVASLAIFVAYQLVALRNVKRVLKTLPWYLCTVVFAFAVFFGMRTVNRTIISAAPAASEIKSVQFGVPEPEWGDPSYNNLLVADIVFEEPEVKACVATYLSNAVVRLQKALRENAELGNEYASYPYMGRAFETGVSNAIIPVRITLHNGRVIRRTIEFTNMNTLNAARYNNAEFMAAIRMFPEDRESYYTSASGYNGVSLSRQDAEKIKDGLFDEMSTQGAIASTDHTVREPLTTEQYRGGYYSVGKAQNYGSIYVSGYHGTHRYYQYYTINLDTPKAASLWMQLNNQAGSLDSVKQTSRELSQLREKAEDNSNGNVNFCVTNVPMQDGTKQQINLGYSTYFYQGAEQGNDVGGAYIDRMFDILSRGTLTSDPNALNVCMYCWIYYAGRSNQQPGAQVYLAFTPEDEKALLTLLTEWNEAQAERERVYNPDYAIPEIAAAVG